MHCSFIHQALEKCQICVQDSLVIYTGYFSFTKPGHHSLSVDVMPSPLWQSFSLLIKIPPFRTRPLPAPPPSSLPSLRAPAFGETCSLTATPMAMRRSLFRRSGGMETWLWVPVRHWTSYFTLLNLALLNSSCTCLLSSLWIFSWPPNTKASIALLAFSTSRSQWCHWRERGKLVQSYTASPCRDTEWNTLLEAS